MTKQVAVQDAALWFRVQAFLSLEARLLDDHHLVEWVDLFSDDVRYWMPVVTNRIGPMPAMRAPSPARSMAGRLPTMAA